MSEYLGKSFLGLLIGIVMASAQWEYVDIGSTQSGIMNRPFCD